MAPVGRWQKDKDLTWYTKDRKDEKKTEESKKPVDKTAIKKAEEDAMLRALGNYSNQSFSMRRSPNLQNEEVKEVLKRSKNDRGIERVEGLGTESSRASMLFSKKQGNEGVAFETPPAKEKSSAVAKKRNKDVSKDSKTKTSVLAGDPSTHMKKKKKHKKHKKDCKKYSINADGSGTKKKKSAAEISVHHHKKARKHVNVNQEVSKMKKRSHSLERNPGIEDSKRRKLEEKSRFRESDRHRNPLPREENRSSGNHREQVCYYVPEASYTNRNEDYRVKQRVTYRHDEDLCHQFSRSAVKFEVQGTHAKNLPRDDKPNNFYKETERSFESKNRIRNHEESYKTVPVSRRRSGSPARSNDHHRHHEARVHDVRDLPKPSKTKTYTERFTSPETRSLVRRGNRNGPSESVVRQHKRSPENKINHRVDDSVKLSLEKERRLSDTAWQTYRQIQKQNERSVQKRRHVSDTSHKRRKSSSSDSSSSYESRSKAVKQVIRQSLSSDSDDRYKHSNSRKHAADSGHLRSNQERRKESKRVARPSKMSEFKQKRHYDTSDTE